MQYWFVLKTDTIQITPKILSLIARIDEFRCAWRALGTLASDREVERLFPISSAARVNNTAVAVELVRAEDCGGGFDSRRTAEIRGD